MLPNLAEQRAARNAALEEAAAMRKRSYRRARMGCLAMFVPLIALIAAVIWAAGYLNGAGYL